MRIKKRDGRLEQLSFDKIIYRLRKLCNDASLHGGVLKTIDPDVVAQRVISSLCDSMTSSELDEEAARIAVGMIDNMEYLKLAARVVISNLHKNTSECFSQVMKELYETTDTNGKSSPIVNKTFLDIVQTYKTQLDFAIDYKRDYMFDYFGYKTLEKSYLLRDAKGKIVERPQHMYMRVAICIHQDDIPNVLKTYHLISQHFYTHASPTLFNAGTNLQNLSSCFLLGTEDSIEGIFKTLTDCARISKVGGGIGVHISNIRSKGSKIRGTNGSSDGIIPLLKVYNDTCLYVNQSGRRKGSFAMYIEPWHADVLEFVQLKRNIGGEEFRARDLFYSVWVNDLFMSTVKANGDWYLMCPDLCPGLNDAYGDAFTALYNSYVEKGKYKKKIKAQDLWSAILDSQIETGVPYIGYKDAVNNKCNQKNLGTIKSSNLCTEISLYSDNKEYATCNLCSIALPRFVEEGTPTGPTFNFELLRQTAYDTVLAMNRVIDNNFYPTEETKYGNFKNRPIGIGVQGLADVYIMMRVPFESESARKLNLEIFETLYYGAITASIDLAKKDGPYPSFEGSPFSQGLLQFDLSRMFDGKVYNEINWTPRHDWNEVKENLKKYGIRNSMLTALMPTASTAQIMGFYESFEPMNSCIFKRKVLSGEYIVVNKYLVSDLLKLGLWSKEMKDRIISGNGSIQQIKEIPQEIKDLYKTVWEIKMKNVILQARDRGLFIDQMQSMNLFMSEPTYKTLTSMHFFAWESKLKTGMYYLRSKAGAAAAKFTVDVHTELKDRDREREQAEAALLCSLENKDACMMCSS